MGLLSEDEMFAINLVEGFIKDDNLYINYALQYTMYRCVYGTLRLV